MKNLANILLFPRDWARTAMARIDKNECGIVLVVDDERRLVGTITDGDLRRAVLRGTTLDAPVQQILEFKAGVKKHVAVCATTHTPTADLLAMMRETTVRQIPILDDEQRVVDLVTLADLMPPDALPVKAVIMAGGFGKRLAPLTEDVPKPMLPLGDRPMMEHIVGQLRQAGIHRMSVTTHYKGEKIREHFGDGTRFGVAIDYINEEQPLGTAGALGLMEKPTEPLLVMNGDIVTRVDFRAMLAFHREHRAQLTVGVRQYDFQVPYGVIEGNGALVSAVREKPNLSFLVNAGIYLLEPMAQAYILPGRRFDMTDLISRLIAEKQNVASFPIIEYWLDIGQHQEYARAQQDLRTRSEAT